MALVFRPSKQNRVSDPLYTGSGGVLRSGFPRIPSYLRWTGGITLLAFLLAYLPGQAGVLFTDLRWLLLLVAVLASLPFAYRAVRQGMLWRLRNKLILTYLLIGLTPVILFLTLVFLSAYVAAGQFAIHLAAARFQLQLDDMWTIDQGLAIAIRQRMEQGIPRERLLEFVGRPSGLRQRTGYERQMALYVDGAPVDVPGVAGNDKTPLRLAPWLPRGERGRQLKFFASDGGVLYIAAVNEIFFGDRHRVTVIGSVPVTSELLRQVGDSLGQVTLLPAIAFEQQRNPKVTLSKLRSQRLAGGSRMERANLLDGAVGFSSTLSVVDWDTGEIRPVPLTVVSRPSVLFNQLFGSGLTGRITDTVRLAFVAVFAFFALLEALAFYLAVRLTRTMTGSVEDLYAATLFIDGGDLSHRIQVQRDDQLADLCRSFNRMSWSLGRLIQEQKEKERMQSELGIAQEVQANLFPRSNLRVPSLDLHGICRPARTVSGDYYDFLVFHDNAANSREITGLGIALGDISGKGISAALLMATLHSAVRAYRFASEELLTGETRAQTDMQSLECGELFDSPARILALLNRHLYRTTQPEKYATLFLAHYDDRSARLTYSNGGQLPPFLLRANGTVKKLDCGGTVVGLMDNMRYQQETLLLQSGDLIIAYSDGVTEPENDFGEFGEDRLLEVVRQYRDEPLATISAEVMRALDAWIGGGEQPDDITLVLARKT